MNSFCVFTVGDRRVGVPLKSVREILPREFINTTPLPIAPPCIRGLFNLRGDVVPFLELGQFVGAANSPLPVTKNSQAVVIERGDFRFATPGQKIDTVEVADEELQPLNDAALHPALDASVKTERDTFVTLHLDRLEACLKQAMKNHVAAEAANISTAI